MFTCFHQHLTILQQWQSFGWSIENEAEDRRLMHFMFFCTVSCGIVLGSLIWAYLPDAR